MDPNNEAIYSKALFRTASLLELKNALSERGILFGPSDTYYLLTLRLRAEILKSSNIQAESCKMISEEIKAILASQSRTGSTYKCCIPGCPFLCKNYQKYLNHLDFLHKNGKSRLVCQYRHGCERNFPSVEMLKSHYLHIHRKKSSSVEIRQNQLVDQIVTLKCLKISCGNQRSVGIPAFKKHLYSHTMKKEDVQCPFCSYTTNVTGTLQQHLSRKHPVQTTNTLIFGIAIGSDTETEIDNEDVVSGQECLDSSLDDVAEDEDSENDEEIPESMMEEVFMKALSILFNTWMNISNISWSTVNEIVVQVFDSYDKGAAYTKEIIGKRLAGDGLETEKINEILSFMDKQDVFQIAKEQLKEESKRMKYLKETFPHVDPVTVRLNDASESTKETCQYIPIKDSLKIFLENESYIKQKREDPYFYEEGLIKDIRDGAVFRENVFFNSNPGSIPLLLFVDELKVANPLGAGKVRHKINMSYYTSLDVQPQLRTKVKSIQLVSVVLSRHWKKYGNAVCNKQFITDLKQLEQEGLNISKPVPMNVKVGLCCIVGDNLGQHAIGEYSTNFSSGYICRWCKTTYQDACKDGKCYNGCKDDFSAELWTEDEYERNADLAEGGVDTADTFGIKKNCVFNSLQSFHCSRQLAPCLGHDVFEGVFAKDIQFYLEFLISKEKLMDVELYNLRIRNFQLSDRDSRNRPKEFKKKIKNSKYEGNAGSLRVLSRIITILLTSVLDQSRVGAHIIKLQEVCELITAPRLTVDEIDDVLALTVHEYLDLRVAAVDNLGMSNLKPKHHFLGHYARIYKENGPLMSYNVGR